MPAAGAIALVAIVWIATAAIRWLSPAGDSVSVRSFVGMQFTDAEDAARAAHLRLHIVARKPDYHAPKDRIVGQLPAAGEHVREGRSVDVVVSDGEPTAKVPNVANMSVRDATVALENARLDVGSVQTQNNADVAEGTVLAQNPESLSNVRAGTKVDLVTAKGWPVTYAPNFGGLSFAEASAAAKDAHLGLAPPVQMPITNGAPSKGTVVSQDPPAGQQMKPHERVTLHLSGGAPPSPSPSPTAAMPVSEPPGTATPTPNQTILSAPATPRGVRVSVALPQSPQPARIRVVLLDASGSRTLYDQQTSGGFTLSFDLTLTGAGTLQTFVGESLVNSTSI